MDIRSYIRNKLIRPEKSYYTLWNMPAERARNTYPEGAPVAREVTVAAEDGPHRYTIRELTREDLPLFDAVRPEAKSVPRNYLDQGQIWIGAIDEDGALAAYTFLVLNEGDEDLLVKRYFIVEPGEAYLHSAWTHPDHRRRGLHDVLTGARITRALESDRIKNIVTHVALGLLSSEKTFRNMGFDATHHLTIKRYGPKGKVTNSRRPISHAPHETDSGALRVMVLDGQTPAAVAVIREIVQQFSAQIIVGSDSHASLGAKSRYVWHHVLLPSTSSDDYVDRLRQSILALKPDVVVSVRAESASAAIDLRNHGDLAAVFVAPESLQGMLALREQIAEQRGKLSEQLSAHTDSCNGILYHGGYFVDGKPLAQFQFTEVSGPPAIASGIKNAALATKANETLKSLDWTGFACLAFTEESDGTLSLVGAEPGLWNSYALATKSDVPIASIGIEHALGMDSTVDAALDYPEFAMVFPVREAGQMFASRNFAQLPGTLKAMLTPGTKWDVDLANLVAYLPQE